MQILDTGIPNVSLFLKARSSKQGDRFRTGLMTGAPLPLHELKELLTDELEGLMAGEDGKLLRGE